MAAVGKRPFQFLVKAPRNTMLGSAQCVKKYSPLKCVSSETDAISPDKNLAVLFLRKDWPSRSSFQDKSTDNISYKTDKKEQRIRACEFYKNRDADKHKKYCVWKPPKPTSEENINNSEPTLKEQKSEYSICTICALKKKKKKIPSESSETEDSEEYQECISNISSTHSISSQRQAIFTGRNSKMPKKNSIGLMYKKHTMLSRETQTSFTHSEAGTIWSQSKKSDRAIKIDYGRSNYLSYQNLYRNKNGNFSIDTSKDESDIEGEYMINCLRYSSSEGSQDLRVASKLRVQQTRKKEGKYENLKYPTRSMGGAKTNLARHDKTPDNSKREIIHLSVSSNTKISLPEEKHVHKKYLKVKEYLKPTHKKHEEQPCLQKTALPDMHARAMSFMKKDVDKARTQYRKSSDYKKDESFYKIKLLEMAGKEIMGNYYSSDVWKKRKNISHRRTTLKHKMPLNSFTLDSNRNITQNSSDVIGSYQKPALLTSSVKHNVKKTRKLKG